MKKIISVFLVLIISAIFVFPSFAAQNIEFIAYGSEVFAGDEFVVDIFISDNSELKTATLLVEYDKNAMHFLDLNIGAIVPAGSDIISFKDVQNGGKSYIQIDYNDSTSSLSTTGKFVSLIFMANDTAIGENDIKLSASNNQITTKSGVITPQFENCKIKIINNNPTADSATVTSSEESTATESSVADITENNQNANQNVTEEQSGNTSDASSAEKTKKGNVRLAIAAVAAGIIVVAAMLFETKNKRNHKKRKSKNKGKRKTGR